MTIHPESIIAKKPVFIVGSARSGTVFMGEVLKNHPAVHCLIKRPEVFQFASRLALNPDYKIKNIQTLPGRLREMYFNAWEIKPGKCLGCSRACRRAARKPPWFWRPCQSAESVQKYADKSHQHILNIDLIQRAFPEAQFLHLIRDGRDAISSMLPHRGVMRWFSEEYINECSAWPQPWFGVKNLDHYREWLEYSLATKAAMRWVSWVREGLRQAAEIPPTHWMDIRYEELVHHPVEITRQIYHFLELEPDDTSAEQSRPTSVGLWSERLTASELEDIMQVAEETLRDLDYV